jgi:Flp pilus assembly pilin Flp
MDIEQVRAAIHRLGRSVRRTADERGASVVEYALLIALIAVVLFSAVSFLGDTTDASFSGSAESITEATAP